MDVVNAPAKCVLIIYWIGPCDNLQIVVKSKCKSKFNLICVDLIWFNFFMIISWNFVFRLILKCLTTFMLVRKLPRWFVKEITAEMNEFFKDQMGVSKKHLEHQNRCHVTLIDSFCYFSNHRVKMEASLFVLTEKRW